MTETFVLRVKHSFSAAHYLRDYEGPCARLHGHDYKVELEIKTSKLDHRGLAVDCADLKKLLAEVCDAVDHRCLNDLEPFTKINPSAENIAVWLYDQIASALTTIPNVEIETITLWETEKFYVRYSRQQ